ncbi:hypothetical protein [Actinoallomurus sp. CA-150999]|uniref:hypothetical protein n=1 Tax=Actinoallomurus sp. CA-150999 TaxID=3239887 RepID=UPI003D92B75B
MTYALDAVLIRVIGAANVVVFRMSRGRVLLHRFDGPPHVRLTEIGRVPELDPPSVQYLRDGDDYVLLVPARLSDARWVGDLRAATSATVEIEEGTTRSAVSVVGDGEADAEEVRRLHEEVGGVMIREMDADVFPVVGEAEQSTAAARLVKGASLDERYDMRKERLLPVARLRVRRP